MAQIKHEANRRMGRATGHRTSAALRSRAEDAIKNVVIGDRRGFNGSWGGPGRDDQFFSWFGVGQAFVEFVERKQQLLDSEKSRKYDDA